MGTALTGGIGSAAQAAASAGRTFRPLRLLVPVVGVGDRNFEVAIELAREFGSQLSLLVRQFTPALLAELAPGGEMLRAQLRAEAQERLHRVLAASPADISVSGRSNVWTPRALLEEIVAGNHDTVLLNAEGDRSARRLAARLLRADTGATVLVVPPRLQPT